MSPFIVAEDITSRFLNVVALFNKAIPLIAVQMEALQVGGVLTLNATTVLDLVPLGTDEEDEPGQATDRAYWINRGSEESVALADELLALLNETTGDHLALKYNKHYIGLARDGVTDNLMTLRARGHHVLTKFRIPRSEEVSTLIEESGIESFRYSKREGRYTLSLRQGDLEHHRNALVKLMRLAGGDAGSDTEPAMEAPRTHADD